MENHEGIRTALGTALLFTIITSIFSLPNKFSALIVTNGQTASSIKSFLRLNLLWIITAAAIIILLTLYYKKSKQSIRSEVFQNENVRLTAGVLIAIDGIINLVNLLPVYITSIQTALKIPSLIGTSAESIITKYIIVYVISIAAIVCQILSGFYLAKHKKKAKQ